MIHNLIGGGAGGGMPKFTYSGNYTLLDDGDDNWRVKFLTSGTLTFEKNPGTIDVFLCGGGAGGRKAAGWAGWGAAGGGGGYTKTQVFTPQKDTEYEIIIGAGGAVDTVGGASSAFGFSANGGNIGGSSYLSGDNGNAGTGGAVGSGAGGGSRVYSGANGGIDGGNGSKGTGAAGTAGGTQAGGDGGVGQGSTTREFADVVTNTYIVGTEFTADWLSLTSGGEALTPETGVIYSVMNSGEYYYYNFIWNGTEYVATDLAAVYGCGGGGGAGQTSGAVGGKGYHGAANGTSFNGTVIGVATENKGGGGGGSGANKSASASAGGSGIVIIRNTRGSAA